MEAGLSAGSYGNTQALEEPPGTPSTPVGSCLASPDSPSPASLRRTLVVATVDAERYTAVDITDIIDDGSIIRTRILNKLGIGDDQDQAKSLIYQTAIGAFAIGQPLSDEALSEMCYEHGDSRATLAFIIQYPPLQQKISDEPLIRPQEQIVKAETSRQQTNVTTQSRQRQQTHLQTPNNELSNRTTHINKPGRVHSPEHRTTRPQDVLIEGQGDSRLHELPPRQVVRPLPAIPTPTSPPSFGTPLSGEPYANLQPLVDEFDVLSTFKGENLSNMESHRVGGVEGSNRRTIQGLPLEKHITKHRIPVSKLPIPFKWMRGELVGRGKYGSVHLGLSVTTGGISLFAVKQIDISSGRPGLRSIIQGLRAESEILRHLNHVNIVRYFGLEETSEYLNIFMEYVPGGTIASYLREYGNFAEDVTKSFTAQIVNGLAYLHSRHLLHRDLKAENVLVDRDGSCKISDFTISKHADRDGFAFTELQGTLYWMAPEVMNTQKKGYSTKIDIWSLGCLVLEMWTNARPWSGLDTVAVMMKLYEMKLPPPIPEGLSLTDIAKDFYNKCFTIDPKERPTAAQMQTHAYLQLPPYWNFIGFTKETLDASYSMDVSPLAPTPSVYSHMKVPHNSPVEYALHDFHRYSSTSETPEEWLHANQIDLQEHIVAFRNNTAEWFLRGNWVHNEMIYERVITLIRYKSMNEFPWDDVTSWMHLDALTSLHKYKIIGERLREFCAEEHFQYLKEIIALDIDSICARLFIILKDPEQYRNLVDLTGDEAQGMLNLIQTLLDFSFLDSIFRSPFMNALLRLSRKSGLYPDILLQDKVTLEGGDAVAAGQFGDVWKGKFRDRPVAVKVLKLYVQSDITKHFKKVLHETLIWRQLRHNHVLPFLCLHHVNNNRARIGLVSPWLDNGNVQDFLRRVPDVDRMSLVHDIAEGLEYLHSMQPTIVHGDLKAVNILITDTHQACLADFGLSTASDSQVLRLSSFSMGQTGGTSRWTAPELLDGTTSTNNMKSDIYAFACICYEIFSGKIPFHDVISDYPVILNVIRGQRPLRPSYCEPWKTECKILGLTDSFWSCVEDCWNMDPEQRPTVHDILHRLPRVTRRRHRQSSLPLDHLQRRDELWLLLDPI